jgi:DNA-binding winged helix-turn-helix (wHTH) protein
LSSCYRNPIYRLRRKIEPEPTTPRYIHTVKGAGYVFQADRRGPLDGMLEIATEANDFAGSWSSV